MERTCIAWKSRVECICSCPESAEDVGGWSAKVRCERWGVDAAYQYALPVFVLAFPAEF